MLLVVFKFDKFTLLVVISMFRIALLVFRLITARRISSFDILLSFINVFRDVSQI